MTWAWLWLAVVLAVLAVIRFTPLNVSPWQYVIVAALALAPIVWAAMRRTHRQ